MAMLQRSIESQRPIIQGQGEGTTTRQVIPEKRGIGYQFEDQSGKFREKPSMKTECGCRD